MPEFYASLLGSATYVLCGGCQVAKRDCRNHSLWVNLWVRILVRAMEAMRCPVHAVLPRENAGRPRGEQ